MNMQPFKKYLKTITASFMFLSMPASTGYELKTYDLNGGGGVTSSSSYQIYGALGSMDLSDQILGTTRNLQPGIAGVIGASTPPAPAFVNSGNWYNRLLVTIDTTGNAASDTLYAVSISPDNWSTVYYVKADNTVTSVLSLADYRDYTSWGGGSGTMVLGLLSSQGYQVRASALQGQFTESGFGPASSTATTSAPELTFDIDISASDTETSPAYTMSLGVLTQNAVTTAAEKIWFDFETNGDSGAVVWIKGLNGGLASIGAGHTITSASVDLANVGVSEGFGIRSASATRSSGATVSVTSPFNGSNDNVGALTSSYQQIYSVNAPVVAARTSMFVKAKVYDLTPAARDYQEVLLGTAVPTF